MAAPAFRTGTADVGARVAGRSPIPVTRRGLAATLAAIVRNPFEATPPESFREALVSAPSRMRLTPQPVRPIHLAVEPRR